MDGGGCNGRGSLRVGKARIGVGSRYMQLTCFLKSPLTGVLPKRRASLPSSPEMDEAWPKDSGGFLLKASTKGLKNRGERERPRILDVAKQSVDYLCNLRFTSSSGLQQDLYISPRVSSLLLR